uniref:BPTI/Kunitz inhibitor domain-containing protein n=1 Tax=Varanus komodoensis TaxID=61221 RepID=A0A8D2L084_VARKO
MGQLVALGSYLRQVRSPVRRSPAPAPPTPPPGLAGFRSFPSRSGRENRPPPPLPSAASVLAGFIEQPERGCSETDPKAASPCRPAASRSCWSSSLSGRGWRLPPRALAPVSDPPRPLPREAPSPFSPVQKAALGSGRPAKPLLQPCAFDLPQPEEGHFCLLPPEPGRCEAYIPRYYYQPATKRCLTFTYGGCGGNANNFKTREECEQRCAQPRVPAHPPPPTLALVRSERCQGPPVKGPCRARLRRFYYSPAEKACLPFFYGGCEGNSNNFRTRRECERACGRAGPGAKPSPAGQHGRGPPARSSSFLQQGGSCTIVIRNIVSTCVFLKF